MSARGVARRLQLDDEDDGPVAAPARGGSGRQSEPVLGPLSTAGRGRGRALPAVPGGPVRTGSQRMSVSRPASDDSGDSDDVPSGAAEAKPGAQRVPLGRGEPAAAPGRGSSAPARGDGETPAAVGSSAPPRPAARAQREPPVERAPSVYDSQFLRSPDTRRPHAAPEEKYGAEEKLADGDLDARVVRAHDKARLVTKSAVYNTDFNAPPPPGTTTGTLYVEAPASGVFQRRHRTRAQQAAAQNNAGSQHTGASAPQSDPAPPSAPVGQVLPFASGWLEALESIFLLCQGLLAGVTLMTLVVAQQFDTDTEFVVTFSNIAGPVRFGTTVLVTIALLGSAHVLLRMGSTDAARQFTPVSGLDKVTASDPGALVDADGDGDVDDDDVAANVGQVGGGERGMMLLKAALQSPDHGARLTWYARLAVGAYGLAMVAVWISFPASNTLASVAGQGTAASTFDDALDDVGTWRVLAGITFLGALVGWILSAFIQRLAVARGRELAVEHLTSRRRLGVLRRRLAYVLGETRGDMSVERLTRLKDIQVALSEATQTSIETLYRAEVRRAARAEGEAGESKS